MSKAAHNRPGQGPAKQQAKVPYHPCFGQPKVESPVLRGKKKGCLGFQTAYRRREAGKPLPPAPLMRPRLTTEEVGNKFLVEYTEIVRDYLLRIESTTILMGLAKWSADDKADPASMGT